MCIYTCAAAGAPTPLSLARWVSNDAIYVRRGRRLCILYMRAYIRRRRRRPVGIPRARVYSDAPGILSRSDFKEKIIALRIFGILYIYILYECRKHVQSEKRHLYAARFSLLCISVLYACVCVVYIRRGTRGERENDSLLPHKSLDAMGRSPPLGPAAT